MSLHIDELDQVAPDAVSTRDIIEPFFMRTIYVGGLVPLLFRQLGTSGALAPYLEQSRWLVGKLGAIWPALPLQCDVVLNVLGAGHAASFGFMCVALWSWPVICAVGFLRKHLQQRHGVLPISPKEVGQFLVALPVSFLALVLDTTKNPNPLYGFHADEWGFFYLKQWLVFSVLALILGILLYVIGRWAWRAPRVQVPTTR
jgi:hypothetical protein